jgi:enoyl-CoA hydratase/carnithine racemase
MKKAPENRLNIKFAQELIQALREIEQRLGKDAEGAVIIKGERNRDSFSLSHIS